MPFLSSLPYTGLIDTPITPPKKEAIILNKAQWPNALVYPPKNTGVYFGRDQASEDRGCTVLILPAL